MTDDSTLAVRRRTLPQWGRLTAGNAATIALALVVLEIGWTAGPSAGFLTAVGLVAVLESTLFLVVGERRHHPVTLATWVTVVRGAAVAVLAGFVVAGPPAGTGIVSWVPAALFAVAAALDAIDGVLARATDSVTDLGARLDVEIDALVVLVGTIVAVVDGALPSVFLAVGAARYLFVAGQWWRTHRGRPVSALPPNRFRRPLGALAMLAIWLALVPVLAETVMRAVAIAVAVPFLANFCWDWLAVSERIEP
ncbi:CDP-alcohol phosphatidyltransferase family protein [Natronorubrum texcoconense]|uniref:CDP-diacylglycerol--glycerol-3-phosphate 3-phosphatidyltransferase n=1 Tax=Natronorubrum texcoconense TaxID=1095776 RepID=A0A1G9AEL7_9EURY|nr:CDP-alcohol phosphatidyltransferase family protein [Natronorubrum texcoconense]SDK25822.1 CDP-diacylglycerol--glycerol-3-phosphate 3-phosphatidyltransferase [Natronorubrum texcoconense]